MITRLDISIIVIYLLAMLLIGYFSGRKNESQEDYFLAGRSMPWFPIALSVAATMISGNSLVGGPGWAYNDGMYPFMVNITVPFAVFIALSITTPIIYNLKITSVYEYMGLRLGNYSRMLAVTQFMINSIIQASSMIYIPALIINAITGIPFYIIVPITVIIAIIYTIMGGIKAVIWTDAIQMCIIFFAVGMIIHTILDGLGTGFLETLEIGRAHGKLDTLDFGMGFKNTNAFWVTLLGGSAMWIRYFCFDQAQMQRILTAKSLVSAKNSFVLSAFIMNIIYYFMLLIGVMLFVFYEGQAFETSNEIMLNFIIKEIPSGATGLIIAGIFAAAMSSVDSLLNSMTTVFTKDIYEYYFAKNRETSLKTTMLITVIIGFVITFFIIIGFSGSAKSVIDLVGSYISYFSGPALGAFVLAMFTVKANDKGTAVGFIAGLIIAFAVSKLFGVSWLWNPFVGATITIVVGYLVSNLFVKDKDLDEVEKYTAMGVRKNILKNKGNENTNDELPFFVGTREKVVLGFFLLQYIILAIIQF